MEATTFTGHSCLHDGVPAPPRQELPHLEPPHAHSQKQNGMLFYCINILHCNSTELGGICSSVWLANIT